MSNKENARPLLEQETGQAKSNISNSDNTTNCSSGQMVFDLLPCGEINAIATKNLVKLVGCKTARDLQNRIAAEREQGYLILSTCRNGGGYFRPTDGEIGQQEVARFVATLQSRAANTFRVLKAARRYLSCVEGQMDLDEVEGL